MGLDWEWWISRGSENARTLVRSLLPSLALKSLWDALSVEEVLANFRSLFWGIEWVGYPLSWAQAPRRRLIDQHNLTTLLPYVI